MKNRISAGLLALFLGGFGVHRFYLNQSGLGVMYLIFCWTGIPMFIGFIDGLVILLMSDGSFNIKYNSRSNFIQNVYTQPSAPQPIINIHNAVGGTTASNSTPTTNSTQNYDNSPVSLRKQRFEQLQHLKELLDTGILSQDEFDKQKSKILSEE